MTFMYLPYVSEFMSKTFSQFDKTNMKFDTQSEFVMGKTLAYIVSKNKLAITLSQNIKRIRIFKMADTACYSTSFSQNKFFLVKFLPCIITGTSPSPSLAYIN